MSEVTRLLEAVDRGEPIRAKKVRFEVLPGVLKLVLPPEWPITS